MLLAFLVNSGSESPRMGGPLQIPLLEVIELVVLASLVACTVWLARRSLPAGVLLRQKRVEELVAGCTIEVEAIVQERAVWKVQGERLAEEVSGYLDQIDRKRASTTAAASRMKSASEANARPTNLAAMSRTDQIAYARSHFGAE